MTNVYNAEFQGSPCNKDWYDYFVNLTDHKDLECTIHFSSLKKLGAVAGGNGMFPVAMATNLKCHPNTTYPSSNTTSLKNYSLPVHELISMSMSDEIDPRCVETKIPSATFSLKVSGVNDSTQLSYLEEILANFKSKMVRIYRGFCENNNPVIGEDGNPALDYYSGYYHDITCMGNYIITEGKFNYDTLAFDFTAENMFFNIMSQSTNYYHPVDRFATVNGTKEAYQRYPHPYSSTFLSSSPGYPFYQVDAWKIGMNVWECLRATNVANGYGGDGIGLYGYGFKTGVGVASNLSYGVYTGDVADMVWPMQNAGPEPAAWAYRANEQFLQYSSNTSPVSFNLATDQYLCDLANEYKKEPAITTINTFNLFNNLRILPTRNVIKYPEEATNKPQLADGAWRTVGGTKPTPNKVFYNSKNSTFTKTNGIYFPYLTQEYKVLPSMLVHSTVKKEDVDWTDIEYLKSYYVDLITIRSDLDLVRIMLPQQAKWNASTDTVIYTGASTRNPYPSNQNTGFEIVNTLPLPDDDSLWYDPMTWNIGKRTVADFTEGFGRDMPARNILGGVNTIRRGDSINVFHVLWSSSLPANLWNDQPLSIKLWKIAPTNFMYDAAGSLVTTDNLNDAAVIDTTHAYPYITGLPKRVITRANKGDTGISPMFQLTWTMVDDPSLRVGTSVLVPLQNTYMRVYITKQERTFDGGARLTCTGWAYENTGIKVYDPKITDAKATYFVNNPDNDPKGEWMRFTWKVTGDYSPIDPVTYRISYVEQYGSWSVDLGTVSILFGEPCELLVNLPYASEREDLPLNDLINGTGYYHITGYFPPNGTIVGSTMAKTVTTWNNEAFSQLHAGYIHASNEHQPLIAGNLLQG